MQHKRFDASIGRVLDRATNAVAPKTGFPQGPDLSHWRVPDDFGAVQSVDFVFFKVSQGKEKDEYADYMAEESYKATDIRGGFFFDDFWVSAEENVERYIEWATPMNLDAHAGDWEPYYFNKARSHVLKPDRVVYQLEELEKAFPGKPILQYYNGDVLQNFLRYDPRLLKYPLWFSAPYRSQIPSLQKGFDVFLWQKSWQWPWPGFKNKVHAADTVDWNVSSMLRPDFRELMLPNATEPEDPNVVIKEVLPDVMSVSAGELSETYVKQ